VSPCPVYLPPRAVAIGVRGGKLLVVLVAGGIRRGGGGGREAR